MGPTEDVMVVVQVVKKGHFMNTMETFHIYKETHINNQLNEKSMVGCNRIFATVIQWGQPT
jgi:hypothetical protein